MSRPLPFLLGCLALGWTAQVSHLLYAAEPTEWKTIARHGEAFIPIQLKKADSGVVIRGPQDLVAHSSKADAAKDPAVQKEMEALVVKLLKVEAIDWSKQMLLAFNGHRSKDGGGTIKFGTLTVENNVLTVPWQQQDRPSLGIVTPKGMILVERFEGEVKFVPLEK